MKFIMHMTDLELQALISQTIENKIAPLARELAYLTEQRDNEFLKIEEVVAKLKVTDRTIRNWVKAKKLKCHWLGDRQFFLMKDVLAAMKTNI